MPKKMEYLTVNLETASVREEMLEGEPHWVVPMVLMTQDIHEGSQGALFYPGEELERWAPAWNYKPLVAPNHPEKGSACSPEFLNDHKIGVNLNTFWDKKEEKQRSEGWFNQRRTRELSPKIAEKIENKEVIELSTGLYVDTPNEAGLYKNKAYKSKALNHKPDHVAILPDHVGACSVKKGCGCLQLNEQSHEDIRMSLESALSDMYESEMEDMPSLSSPWVRAVYDGYCVYWWAGRLYSCDYSSSDDKVTLVGDPTEVEQKVEYVPVGNTSRDKNLEEVSMAKKDWIDRIIANSEKTNFEEADRKILEAFPDAKLEKMAKNCETKAPPAPAVSFNTQEEFQKEVQKAVEEIVKKPGAVEELRQKQQAELQANNTQQQPTAPMTMEAWLAAMPAQARVIHNNMIESYNKELKETVTAIIANKSNTFTEGELLKMDIRVLRNMAAMSKSVDQQTQTMNQSPAGVFWGQAGAMSIAPPTQEQVLKVPTYNQEEFAKNGGFKK